MALVVTRAFSADLHRYRFYTTSWDSNEAGEEGVHERLGARGQHGDKDSLPPGAPGGETRRITGRG